MYFLSFSILSLIGLASITFINTLFHKIGFYKSKNLLYKLPSFKTLGKIFILSKEAFFFIFNAYRILLFSAYAFFTSLYLAKYFYFGSMLKNFRYFLLLILGLYLFYLFFDMLCRIIAIKIPKIFKISYLVSSLYIYIFFPVVFLPYLILKITTQKKKETPQKNKVLEAIQSSDLEALLSPQEQKFISSFINFKDRTAREVMIPRINVFGLDATVKVNEAINYFLSEDYSRVPIYKETLDNIIGVLLYKDLLKLYAQNDPELLLQPIEALSKQIIYTPENKKISNLLQEFKSKHIHMAVVVNEYGATEGIVTIEDILEELVGEIEDEYDIHKKSLFTKISDKSFLIEAKMSIVDLEDELNIRIPPSSEYETIGGFVFHKAGSIPLKGWAYHHDNYDIEVVHSNERNIEKVKITLTTL